MQNVLKRLMLVGAVSLFLSPAVALSDWMQIKMTQEQAEEAAKMAFGKEIREGKLTQKQAGAYYKCTEEDYAQNYMDSPEGKKHMDGLDKISASEMKALEKLRGQSEDKCVKQLGLKTKPQAGM